VINDRLAEAGAPNAAVRNVIGYGMGAPTVVTHGTEEQKQRYLRPLFTGEEIWCQLFSEPGAGSDVAGLATRAVRDGDEWIINGQKVWTTLAHLAKWGMLVARTDADAPKHKGMTYFVVDMHAPGVDVKPLYQITGEAEFNEVFFTDVRIPDAERLGDTGEGWRVTLTTLMNERVAIGGGIPPRGGGMIGEAVKIWKKVGGDGAKRDKLMKLWTDAEVLRLTNIRASHLRSAGNPGPEGSIGKIVSAQLNKHITEFAVELLGAEGMLKPDGYPMERPTHAMMWANPQQAFLRTRANSIEGGTTEIAKNILGERVLGLPGDVRIDKDVPWKDVPRS
jgi:alkylation response protein AidB-like acyl-CoA dehydrogenase